MAQCLLREGRAVRASHGLAIRETASMKKPPTGEPYAGEPPVRFGGRGGHKPFPTPIMRRFSDVESRHGSRVSLRSPGMTVRESGAGARVSLREAKLLPDACLGALFQQRMPECDVAEAEPAVPEQDGFVVALTAGLQAGDDL